MSDEDLRELERQAPHDAAAAVRFARALARRGETARAASELARVVDQSPADQEALAELDRLTRGGVDPSSPWPGGRGDGRHSGRSWARGPERGGQLARVALEPLSIGQGLAVDARGCLLAVGGPGINSHLLTIEQDGGYRKHHGGVRGAPLLLAGATVTVFPFKGSVQLTALEPRRGSLTDARGPCAAGLGHAVFARGKQGVEARLLPTRDAEKRWAVAIPRPAAAIAFGPGAIVLVLTKGGLGARGSFHRFELGTGKALSPVSLERLGSGDERIIAGEDGTVFLGLGSATLSLDPEGRELWRHESTGTLVALAGESADVVVVSEPRTSAPFALDARTGKELWRSRDACLNGQPKVDATGRIFWRREQELVAFEPRSGEIVYQALVGPHFWDFAFDGKGHAVVLNYGSRELLLLE